MKILFDALTLIYAKNYCYHLSLEYLFSTSHLIEWQENKQELNAYICYITQSLRMIARE